MKETSSLLQEYGSVYTSSNTSKWIVTYAKPLSEQDRRLSYGTGRPAVLKDDESIHDCRDLLRHPYAIDDDMRLVSTVELIQIRERIHNALSPLTGIVQPEHYNILREGDADFELWYKTWDHAFSRKWPDAGKVS